MARFCTVGRLKDGPYHFHHGLLGLSSPLGKETAEKGHYVDYSRSPSSPREAPGPPRHADRRQSKVARVVSVTGETPIPP
jgi:hypothetical protein